MEKGSMSNDELSSKERQLTVESLVRSNELSSNKGIVLNVSNSTTSKMTNEKTDHFHNNRTSDKLEVNKSNLNKTNEASQKAKQTRRELGNRGYIKKMRKIPFLGIFCGIMYAFFMSTSVALLKVVPNLHPIAVLVYRCLIQAGVFWMIALYNQKSLLGVSGERYSLAGRAISGMLNQLCWYTSIRYISLTDSSAIYYSAPVFVAVLAFFMLGEKFGIYECSSVIITLIGVTLVSKPGFLPFFNTESSIGSQLTKNDSVILRPILSLNLTANSSSPILPTQTDYILQTKDFHVFGMVLAFMGAITFALSNIYVRQMRKTSTEITAFWFGMVIIIACAPLAYALNVMTLPAGLLEWSVVIIVGVFAVLGQISFTLALKIEKAGPVSVSQSLNIAIVLFYQIVFFHESITMTSLIGVFLIILSVMIIGFKDMMSDTELIKKTMKKLSKSSNGQFKLNSSSIVEDGQWSTKKGQNLTIDPVYAMNYGIKIPAHHTDSPKPFHNSVCIAGNCKNNVCFNGLKEQSTMYLQSYDGSKYIKYLKNDIY